MASLVRVFCRTVVTGLVTLLPSSSFAHHSFAMFDYKTEVVLDGTVREFQWTNPHSWIQLVVGTGGKTVEYSVELQSVSSLTRLGWSKNAVKAGDQVKVVIHPLRDGSNGGSFVKATFPNGRVLDGQIAP